MTPRQAAVDAALMQFQEPPTARQVASLVGISREAALSRLKALERNGYVRSVFREPGVKVWMRR